MNQEQRRGKVVTMPLAELVEDMDVYPRHACDPLHVRSLADALEAGAKLPPIVADAKSKRVIDGWHRCRAHKLIYGPECSVSVELRTYGSEAELIEDAVRMNAAHGRRLDRMDQARAVVMLERAGVSVSRIPIVLNMPEARVETLRLRLATSRSTVTATVPGTRTIVLKRPVKHLAGHQLTAEQAKAHDSAPGTTYGLLARQLRDAVAFELLDREDAKLMEGLKSLYEALAEVFG